MIKVLGNGDFYIANQKHHQVLYWNKSSQTVDLFAGSSAGTSGVHTEGESPTNATFNSPISVDVDPWGNPIISDYSNGVVRRVWVRSTTTSSSPDPVASTNMTTVDNYIGGNTTTGYNSPGGFNAQTVPLIYPFGLAWNGNMTVLYISERAINRIVAWNRITDSTSVFAGMPGMTFSGDGGQATAATIGFPSMLFYENTSNVLYFGDSSNERIRKVDVATGIISTFVRRLSLCYWLINIFCILQFSGDVGCESIFVAPNGESWIAYTYKSLIIYRAINGTTSTYAGTGSNGYDGIELTV